MGAIKQVMIQDETSPHLTQMIRDFIPDKTDHQILSLIASNSYTAYLCDACNGYMPDPDISGKEVTVCDDCYPD